MKLKLNEYVVTFLVSILHSTVLSLSASIETNNQTIQSVRDFQPQVEKPILIIVSYDGFRNEYLERNVTPSMLKFRSEGIYTDQMLNVFPTKTFTNHFSIATGFYPDTHGVLANQLFDSVKGYMGYSYDLFHYNDSVQPIWIVNENGNGTSGCMMWPGSNYNYSGVECTYTLAYNSSVPLTQRVDTMMEWLTDPLKPANLVMFYSEQPDKLAHVTGPDTKNITEVVAALDTVTKYIQEQLIAHKLENRTNVIHLSDHGMAGVPPAKFINLTVYLEADSCDMYGSSPVLQIVPKEGKLEYIYQALKNASKINGNFDIYKSEELPTRWHATNKQRFGPLVAVAKMNYAFQDLAVYAKDNGTSYGVHGYDNQEELMHPIFMAKGPAFQSGGQKAKPFESVDLFQLFTEILGIKDSSKRDGSRDRILQLLAGRSPPESESSNSTITIIIVAICGLGVVAGAVFYVMRKQKRRSTYSPT